MKRKRSQIELLRLMNEMKWAKPTNFVQLTEALK